MGRERERKEGGRKDDVGDDHDEDIMIDDCDEYDDEDDDNDGDI